MSEKNREVKESKDLQDRSSELQSSSMVVVREKIQKYIDNGGDESKLVFYLNRPRSKKRDKYIFKEQKDGQIFLVNQEKTITPFDPDFGRWSLGQDTIMGLGLSEALFREEGSLGRIEDNVNLSKIYQGLRGVSESFPTSSVASLEEEKNLTIDKLYQFLSVIFYFVEKESTLKAGNCAWKMYYDVSTQGLAVVYSLPGTGEERKNIKEKIEKRLLRGKSQFDLKNGKYLTSGYGYSKIRDRIKEQLNKEKLSVPTDFRTTMDNDSYLVAELVC
ncbi:MAG: hypothetical protein ABIH87_00870 [bacterium]